MNQLQKTKLGLIVSILLTIIILIIIIYFSFFNKPNIPQYNFDYNDLYYSEENIEIYLLPNQEAIDKVIEKINDANSEIHCALRALNYEDLEKTFVEKEKSVKVRLYINADYSWNDTVYMPSVKFEPERDENAGMMHNNYCILDQETVIAGSIMFNGNTIVSSIHDVVIIKSKELAKEYNNDFWRIYNNQNVEKRTITPKEIQINDNTKMSVYFCPIDSCEEKLIEEFSNANKSIKAGVYLFTNEKLIEILKEKQDLEKKIILEPYGITKNSLIYEKIDGVKLSHTLNKMHTKLITIDNDTTITGTMSPTYYGPYKNQENILIIKNEKINNFYNNLIDYLYQKTKPN